MILGESYDGKEKLTEEEVSLLQDILQHLINSEDAILSLRSSSFFIRMRKVNYDWNAYLRQHVQTGNELSNIAKSMIWSVSIPFEDLPLYINHKDKILKLSANYRLSVGR
jgi:hypothetical protein